MTKKSIVFLTGAGMSAESGISTFRDSNGLWENHAIEDVATYEAFERNIELALEFYNARRKQLFEVEPNEGHNLIAGLEDDYKVSIITQNVDDLHERAGSKSILHLHGELRKVRSTADERLIYYWDKDVIVGDKCKKGSQLRPHIVWFGEAVPAMEAAIDIVNSADVVVVIGTSLQVYPAASLMDYAKPSAKIFYIDPKPNISSSERLTVLPLTASEGMKLLIEKHL
ncbi:MAG: NAD-dependent deacylase [Flavobacteriales bacterium]|jgi:NAD-dependent deacetylase|nr:NAD-dependent deacylase [Flavobacteriales bacterium]